MPEYTHVKLTPMTRGEMLRAAAYVAILLWVNIYIARDFFSGHTAYMNSMHGFWIAMAKRGAGAWFHPAWWPYWDCGIPFEAAYAPLVPWLTAAWAATSRTPLRHGVLLRQRRGLLPGADFPVPHGLGIDARSRNQFLRRALLFARLADATHRAGWRFPLGSASGRLAACF